MKPIDMRRRRDERRHGNCKLDRIKVRAIKDLLALGQIQGGDIAKQFGVSGSTVSNIKSGKIWRDVAPTSSHTRSSDVRYANGKGDVFDAFQMTADTVDEMPLAEWPPWLDEAERLGYVRTTRARKRRPSRTIIVTGLGETDMDAGDWILRDEWGELSRHDAGSFPAYFDPVS